MLLLLYGRVEEHTDCQKAISIEDQTRQDLNINLNTIASRLAYTFIALPLWVIEQD